MVTKMFAVFYSEQTTPPQSPGKSIQIVLAENNDEAKQKVEARVGKRFWHDKTVQFNTLHIDTTRCNGDAYDFETPLGGITPAVGATK